MKVYAVEHSLHPPQLSFIHYLLFHGKEVEEEPNVSFIPVCFQKVVDFPAYRRGDFSFRETEAFRKVGATIEEFLDGLPDIPTLHHALGCYYELIVARLGDVSPRYRSARPVMCKIPMAAIQKAELLLSADVVDDYPIIWSTYNIFSQGAFDHISPYLDRDYFEITALDV